jgi:hypothetical protein
VGLVEFPNAFCEALGQGHLQLLEQG